ncbi:sensor histidine kinase KdpD [Anaerorhabdus sp.]|uniref:sensor histidine kinase KdpD n=1 Tax=Anaerorhabdus sp. TaxID=1872524 RepID=UPI002FC71B97
MVTDRANPEDLLRMIRSNSDEKKKGNLKIFFGYAAGVGKTYSMLMAAHEAKRRGVDVVCGYVEPHARPQTTALLEGLEMIPSKEIVYNNIKLHEFDLDATIRRSPELVLVDELAHTNVAGSRHDKRYQDVEELINMGIDVYTTINVQHIESLNDVVASITGVLVRERIPDSVFDGADQVGLVDIEPQELLTRLNEGKIYRNEQAQRALTNFFNIENLIALREIALRRCADRVNKRVEDARSKSRNDYFTEEHILVCLSSSPTNSKIIRTAARMASAFKGRLTALFVETPDFSSMSDENRNRLRTNMRLAQQLGATLEIGYGDDIAMQIVEFSRLSGVSKIVIGRNSAKRRFFFSKPSLIEKLSTYSPNLDIYVIPDKEVVPYQQRKMKFEPVDFLWKDFIKSIGILALTTIIGFFFYELRFSEANIITIYILAVLVIAIVTTQRIYSLVSSIVSVLIFNFFFTDPRYTLNAYDSGYPVTFLIMFIAAFITGTLAVKIKKNAKKSAQVAFRTKILLDTNQLLQMEKDKDGIIAVFANQLIKLLGKDIIVYLADGETLADPKIFYASEYDKDDSCLTENERAVAMWSYKNNKHSGAATNTLSNAKCHYLAIRVKQNVYGVLGIRMKGNEIPDAFENNIILSIAGECALALENQKVAEEKEQTAILAKNEQLRANLLRSISHDLRTPLTSISGNAGVLLASEEKLSVEKRRQLYTDIYEDSIWLINLVENLLAVTKLEDGTLHLKITAELIDEVIDEALRHINHHKSEHEIIVHENDQFILAMMDAKLIVQVIINLVDNAIKYTPEGSVISIISYKQDKFVVVEVSDNGPGIKDEDKPRIFDRFYTTVTKVADSHRSLGLGLALCKSIINVHGGEITVKDNKPTGSTFRFTLPIEEVELHD